MGGVEELYRQYGILADAGDKAAEFPDAYSAILSAVKGTPGEKRLAASFITKFFKLFPKLQENAIDALLDLCEDEDNMIRKQAFKGLPQLCKDNMEHLPRIADVLTQLLQTDDVSEFAIVTSSLESLFKMEPKGTIGGLFSQILSGEEQVRDKAIKFLSTAVAEYGKKVLHPSQETEEYLVEEIKKALSDVTGEEFRSFMTILSQLKVMHGAHQELADIVTEQAELNQPFQPSDVDIVDRFISCARQAIPFFLKGASAESFFKYLMQQVIPKLSELEQAEDGEDARLELLKLCAEMSPCKLQEETIKAAVEPIFTVLLDYMPLPPSEGEDGKYSEDTTEPKLQFSYVECLLFAFHNLARQDEGFLTGADATERLKDFRLRLQYFAQGCQVYIKQLRVALQGQTGAALQDKENKIKAIALRTTSNINSIIKDLFHNPPSYKCTVTLSWKTPSKAGLPSEPLKKEPTSPSPLDEKRKRAGITPITFDIPPQKKPAQASPRTKRRGGGGQVYQPPGRRTGASNGKVQGQTMPDGFANRRGRGRRGGWGRGRF